MGSRSGKVVEVVPQILACTLPETTRPPEPWSAQRLPGQACQNMTLRPAIVDVINRTASTKHSKTLDCRIAEKSPRIQSGRGCVGESAGASTSTMATRGMNALYTRWFQKGVVNNTQIRIAGLGNKTLKTDCQLSPQIHRGERGKRPPCDPLAGWLAGWPIESVYMVSSLPFSRQEKPLSRNRRVPTIWAGNHPKASRHRDWFAGLETQTSA
ncbi:hypothetical protein J3E74DRAFT_294398 [Bipolaris maydis]|nr:hypothetical protein J3E74DRAFT_294398 [Bipolaris maydis]